MYLSLLNLEKKHLFLDLELYMTKADDSLSEEERLIIDTHCLEMHIDCNDYQPERSLDEVIESITEQFTAQEKHIAFLELAGSILADNTYHQAEKELVNKLQSFLGITDDEIKIAFSIMSDLRDVYARCADFIN